MGWAEQIEHSRTWSKRERGTLLSIKEFRGNFLEEVEIEQDLEGWTD